MAVMIQARHLFYGLSMLDKFKGLGWKKKSMLIGILVSLVCLILFGANSFMIPTIILIVLLLTVLRKWLEQCDKLKENKRSETTCAYTLAVAVFTSCDQQPFLIS